MCNCLNQRFTAGVLFICCFFIVFQVEKLSADDVFNSQRDISMPSVGNDSANGQGLLIASLSTSGQSRAGRYIKYEIQKGDSLFRISLRYGTTVEEIKRINSLKDDMIKAGQIIRIPDRKDSNNIAVSSGSKSKENTENENKPVFRWPVNNVNGYKRDGYEGVKSIGIIIKSPSGVQVVAAAAGVVEKIGYMRGFGNYVIIRHSSGFSTVYSNICRISIREGERIRVGQRIGQVSGHRGVYFQIDRGGKPEDPLAYLPRRG